MCIDGANISEKFFSVEPFCATLTPDRAVDRGTGRPIELNALPLKKFDRDEGSCDTQATFPLCLIEERGRRKTEEAENGVASDVFGLALPFLCHRTSPSLWASASCC